MLCFGWSGTIGHVAHGKSTVVKALTGVLTVRFKNEKERNITIKLGYANAKVIFLVSEWSMVVLELFDQVWVRRFSNVTRTNAQDHLVTGQLAATRKTSSHVTGQAATASSSFSDTSHSSTAQVTTFSWPPC